MRKSKKNQPAVKPNPTIGELVAAIEKMTLAQSNAQSTLAVSLAPICKKKAKLVTPEQNDTDSGLAASLSRILQRAQANAINIIELQDIINL